MTATKKKPQSKQPAKSGGTLMSMRSSFQKVVGTGPNNKKVAKTEKWSFQKVMLLVGGIALALALFYAFSKR